MSLLPVDGVINQILDVLRGNCNLAVAANQLRATCEWQVRPDLAGLMELLHGGYHFNVICRGRRTSSRLLLLRSAGGSPVTAAGMLHMA